MHSEDENPAIVSNKRSLDEDNRAQTELKRRKLGSETRHRDPSQTDLTPEDYTVGWDYAKIMQQLLDKGADVESKDSSGWTPLLWAAWNGNEEIIQLLLDKGADIESKDSSGLTPLSWAAEKGHKEIVQLLLDRGANIESKNSFGWTPLLWAAWNGNKEIIQLLLDKGANIESKDSSGLTPLSWAAEKGHKEIVQPPLHNGAKPKEYVNVASNINSQLGNHSHGHKTILVQPNSDSGYATLEQDASKTVQTTVEDLSMTPQTISLNLPS